MTDKPRAQSGAELIVAIGTVLERVRAVLLNMVATLALDMPAVPELTTGATDQFFPTDAGLFNVHTYGAVGDGVTDDTVAIQSAIYAACATPYSGGSRGEFYATVLFPAGTYIVSAPIKFMMGDARTWHSWLALQGSGPCVIKLRDNCVGYQNPTSPQHVIWTGSEPGSTPPYFPATGGGYDAFGVYLFDIAIDVGAGNPGAVGVNWIANNVGGMDNVIVRSSDQGRRGYAGIWDGNRYAPGPCLFKNVAIDGFTDGIRFGNLDYSLTFYGLELYRQLAYSIDSTNFQLMSIEKLIAPDLRINAYNIYSEVFLAVANPALTLPAVDTPAPAIIRSTCSTDYVSVVAHGADPTGAADSTVAFQAAIDAGKPIVYLPFGKYLLNGTVHLRGAVQRLAGFGSLIAVDELSFAYAPGWNPADKQSNLVLSRRNTSVFDPSDTTWRSLRSVTSYTSGLRYVEYRVAKSSTLINVSIGIANATQVLSGGNRIGASANSVGLKSSGAIFANNVQIGTVASFVVGDTIGAVWDFTHNKVWISVNGGLWNNDVIGNQNPTTNTGGISFAVTGPYFAAASLATNKDTLLGLFQAAEQTYAAPTGAAAWQADVATPLSSIFQFDGTVDCQIDSLMMLAWAQANPVANIIGFKHNSARALTLKHVAMGSQAYRFYQNSASGTGDCYMEDVLGFCPDITFEIAHPQSVWARSLNSEGKPTTARIVNNGGSLRILGIKTEQGGTIIKSTGAARTELIGGLLYPLAQDATNPAFLHQDTATGSYAFGTSVYSNTPVADYVTILQTPTKTVLQTALQVRGFGCMAPIGTVFG